MRLLVEALAFGGVGVARLLVEALAKAEALGGGSGGLVWAEAQGRLN